MKNVIRKHDQNTKFFNDILERLQKITSIDALWRWEVEKLIGIIDNQMDAIQHNPDNDATLIASQTKIVVDILRKKIICDDFEQIEYAVKMAKDFQQIA